MSRNASQGQSTVISLRLTAGQVHWLDNVARVLATETGHNVSRASILMRLMGYGLPQFERELESLQARPVTTGKLRLVYSTQEPSK